MGQQRNFVMDYDVQLELIYKAIIKLTCCTKRSGFAGSKQETRNGKD